MFDWNDLRFFLELQRSGRLLTAAKRLNTTHSTVARHIESIEKHLGTALFVQHAQGYELTPSGQALLKHAFEGRLTAEWRAQHPDKLESAETLLARIQREREARYQ